MKLSTVWCDGGGGGGGGRCPLHPPLHHVCPELLPVGLHSFAAPPTPARVPTIIAGTIALVPPRGSGRASTFLSGGPLAGSLDLPQGQRGATPAGSTPSRATGIIAGRVALVRSAPDSSTCTHDNCRYDRTRPAARVGAGLHLPVRRSLGAIGRGVALGSGLAVLGYFVFPAISLPLCRPYSWRSRSYRWGHSRRCHGRPRGCGATT